MVNLYFLCLLLSLNKFIFALKVGAYLPESFEEVFFQLSEASKVNYPIPKEGFYQFSADSSKTPALRYVIQCTHSEIFYFLVPEPSTDIVLAFHLVGKSCLWVTLKVEIIVSHAAMK